MAGAPSALVLGDNVFFGHGLPEVLEAANARTEGGTVFGYHVTDPERYGVVDFKSDGSIRRIVEKPTVAPSRYAVTGLYFLDGRASDFAELVRPSVRGELEIADLLEIYRKQGDLQIERLGRGFAWLDTGTHGDLLDAGNFVRTLTERQGLQVGSPDEIAFKSGWIDRDQLVAHSKIFNKSSYGKYLSDLAG